MDPLNLLILCHEYPPVGGGAGGVCRELSREFIRRGHRATVVTMDFGEAPDTDGPGEPRVVRIPCGRQRREMASPWEALRWAHRARATVTRLHDEAPFDATHGHFIMPAGIVATRLKQRDGVPFVLTAHGSDIPGYNPDRLRLAHRLARPWWRRVCLRADRVVCPSRWLGELARRSCPAADPVAIPNGIRPEAIPQGPKQNRILLCSRLVRRKGFQYFLQGMADADLPGWTVDLVGDGPMAGELRELAARCRIPVTMHGWLDRDDPRLSALLGEAGIFVFPSDTENSPLALLEAMAARCAIVAAESPGNVEMVGEAALTVPPHDPGALRAAVVRLAGDPGLRQRLGTEARSRVLRRFAWEAIGREYEALFRTLVSAPRGQGTP